MTYFTQPNNRSPVPASVYSSWVHPDIENSLVRDYWLSNLDRTICEILADNTAPLDKYLAESQNFKQQF